jgi:hypothetical protein
MGLAACVTPLDPKRPADPRRKKAETQNPAGEAETKTEKSKVPPPLPDSNGNALFVGVMDLNDDLTTLHATLPLHTSLLLFSGQ